MPHSIRVFVDSNGKARVFPAFTIAKRGDDVEWANLTSDGINVEVSGFGVAGDLNEWKIVEKKGKHQKTVKNAAKDGAYRSRVFCLQTGTIAEAASDPEIIIVP